MEILVRIEQRQPKAVMQQARPVVVLPIGLQGPAGPDGAAGGQTVDLTAGQNLSTGRVVIVDAGKAWYFQNTDAAHHGRAYGITKTSATANGTVTVALSGIVEDSAFGFAADTVLWVGADGEIFNTQPVTGVIFQKAGVAGGAKKIRIDFSLSTYTN